MEYLIGLLLSVAVILCGAIVGFDRERSFYSTALIVIASYYVLFATMGASGRILILEIVLAGGFILLAVFSFRGNFWLVAAATVGHGIFDLFHSRLITDPGVPQWWPGFCMAFDVIFGAWLAIRLLQRKNLPTPVL